MWFRRQTFGVISSQTYCRRTTGKKRSYVLLVITYGNVTLRWIMVLRLQYNTVRSVQNFSALFVRFIAYCLERKSHIDSDYYNCDCLKCIYVRYLPLSSSKFDGRNESKIKPLMFLWVFVRLNVSKTYKQKIKIKSRINMFLNGLQLHWLQ
jgi:hypothetical protein